MMKNKDRFEIDTLESDELPEQTLIQVYKHKHIILINLYKNSLFERITIKINRNVRAHLIDSTWTRRFPVTSRLQYCQVTVNATSTLCFMKNAMVVLISCRKYPTIAVKSLITVIMYLSL